VNICYLLDALARLAVASGDPSTLNRRLATCAKTQDPARRVMSRGGVSGTLMMNYGRMLLLYEGPT
jgi:hypothetical protein